MNRTPSWRRCRPASVETAPLLLDASCGALAALRLTGTTCSASGDYLLGPCFWREAGLHRRPTTARAVGDGERTVSSASRWSTLLDTAALRRAMPGARRRTEGTRDRLAGGRHQPSEGIIEVAQGMTHRAPGVVRGEGGKADVRARGFQLPGASRHSPAASARLQRRGSSRQVADAQRVLSSASPSIHRNMGPLVRCGRPGKRILARDGGFCRCRSAVERQGRTIM